MKEEPDPHKRSSSNSGIVTSKLKEQESDGKCIECGESFPLLKLYKSKYCPDCAEKIIVCEHCNNEFVFEGGDSSICPSCQDLLSKKCIKCEKNFIPKRNFHYLCPSCYMEYQGSKEIQILNEAATIPVETYKSQNRENSFDFGSLIEDLNGNNPVNRAIALETLCNIENENASSILISALENKDTNIKWKAARHLGRTKNKNAVGPLIKALKDPDFIVRNNAARSLGEIGDKQSIGSLILALEDKNKYVRGSAMEALEKIRNTTKSN